MRKRVGGRSSTLTRRIKGSIMPRSRSILHDFQALESRLRSLDYHSAGDYDKVRFTEDLEKIWVLSEKLGTLPDISWDWAQLADRWVRRLGYSRVFTLLHSYEETHIYPVYNEGPKVSERQLPLKEIIGTLRDFGTSRYGRKFIVTGENQEPEDYSAEYDTEDDEDTLDTTEEIFEVKELDLRGCLILEKWIEREQ